MQYRRGEGFEYLRKYPGLKKWIRTCICCGSTGYDPDLPEKLTRNWGQGEFATLAAQNIRKYFEPLRVNEQGICEICERLNHAF